MRIQLACCALGLVCCCLFLSLPPMVWAESARNLTAQGNELYAGGDYEAALKAYEQAESEQPEAPEIQFNKGNAWFQQGDFEKAKGAYEAAALKAKDPALEAKSQFNMGDGAYSQGRMLLPQDPKRALEQYRQSAAHFKEALRFLPDFQEAAENLELVRFSMKQIEEQLKRQEEQQQQQQQKDKDKDASEKAEAAKDGQQEREKSENENPEEQDQQSQEASRAKPDSSRETEDQKPKPSTPPPGQEQPEEQGKTQQAAKAEEEKTLAAELARDILREEKELRLQRDRDQRSGYLAVEKDW